VTGLGAARSGGVELTAAPQDPAPFALGGAAPDAVLDAELQCVLEALGAYRAVAADALRELDSDTVGREELGGAGTATLGTEHPPVVVRGLFHVFASENGATTPGTDLVFPEFTVWNTLRGILSAPPQQVGNALSTFSDA
jgi:hypothetical protein